MSKSLRHSVDDLLKSYFQYISRGGPRGGGGLHECLMNKKISEVEENLARRL